MGISDEVAPVADLGSPIAILPEGLLAPNSNALNRPFPAQHTHVLRDLTDRGGGHDSSGRAPRLSLLKALGALFEGSVLPQLHCHRS